MIILADPGDESLAGSVQEALIHGGWRQFSTQLTTLDEVAKQFSDLPPNEVFFVVGVSLERLALTIVCLRSLGANPVIAISRGGTVRQIVQLMRVGATDIIDFDGAFDAQLKTIVEQTLPAQQEPEAPTSIFPALRRSEQRVALLLLGELSEQEIADQLKISYFTVRNHVKQIYRKCNVHSRAQFMSAFGNGTKASTHHVKTSSSRSPSEPKESCFRRLPT